MSDEVVIRWSPGKTILVLLGCLGFVALGVFLIFATGNLAISVVAIAAIAFFGLRFLVLLFRVFDRRPRVVIDEKGIEDRLLDVGKIAWKDIKYVDLPTVQENHLILLKLKNPEKYLKNRTKISKLRSRWNGDLDFGIFYVDLAGTDADLHKTYEKILCYAPGKQIQNRESLYEDLDRNPKIQ